MAIHQGRTVEIEEHVWLTPPAVKLPNTVLEAGVTLSTDVLK